MVRMLGGSCCALVCFGFLTSCGPATAAGDGDSTTTVSGSSTDTSGSSTVAESADVTSAPPAETDSSSGDSTGVVNACAAGDGDLVLPVLAQNEAWPETGAFVDVDCTAVSTSASDGFTYVELSCFHAPTMMSITVPISVPEWLAGDHFSYLPGTSGLRASFYNPRGLCGTWCFQLTLREADGSLLLLSQTRSLNAPVQDDAAVDVAHPDWLQASNPGYAGWASPFDGLSVLGAACEAQDESVGLVVPLAMEFTGDAGTVRMFHDTTAEDVSVGGVQFDIALRAFNYAEPDRSTGEAQVQFVAVRAGP